MVVVCPKPGKPTLNLDIILFIERGKRALGHIFDVFGKVSEPYYCVRFNSSEHIKESDIKVGMTVYYCPNSQYTSLVFLSELTKYEKNSTTIINCKHFVFIISYKVFAILNIFHTNYL